MVPSGSALTSSPLKFQLPPEAVVDAVTGVPPAPVIVMLTVDPVSAVPLVATVVLFAILLGSVFVTIAGSAGVEVSFGVELLKTLETLAARSVTNAFTVTGPEPSVVASILMKEEGRRQQNERGHQRQPARVID